MQVQTRGEFYGLGIEVTMENELIKVISPIDDTPAAKAGILSGDLITELDGEPVQGLTLREAVEKMRGPANSSIILTVVREGEKKPLKITVVRDVIRVQSVKSRVENDVGYIRIASFSEQTMDGLEKAIDSIKSQIPADQLKGYVLDLRGNPGGLLDQAVSCPTRSWTAARSSRRAAATPTKCSASARGPATSSTESRSSFS